MNTCDHTSIAKIEGVTCHNKFGPPPLFVPPGPYNIISKYLDPPALIFLKYMDPHACYQL